MISAVSVISYGQCPNNNTFLTSANPSLANDTVSVSCVKAGEYVTTSVVTGTTYVFSTCGQNGFDTELTLRNSTGTVWYAFNDDFCGQQSQITWTATFTGTVRTLIDADSCQHDTVCQEFFVTQSCMADAGTFTIKQNGTVVSSPVYVCEGQDTVEVLSNNDYVLPQAHSGETAELMYYVLDCPPSHANPSLDSCFTGIIFNDEDFMDANPGILSTGQHYYIVPVTVDDGDNGSNPNGIISVDANNDNCFATAAPIEIYYLNPIAFASNIDCSNQAVKVNIFGGSPEVNASNYSLTSTGSGNISNSSIAHGGQVTINNLINGDNYSIDITDQSGCSNTFSGGPFYAPFAGSDVTVHLCSTDSSASLDSMLQASATLGGDWFTPSLTSTTSTFIVGSSPTGTYTYVVDGGVVCPDDTALIEVVIDSVKTAGIGQDTTLCSETVNFNLFNMLSGYTDSSGTWIKPNGSPGPSVLASVPFLPPKTYTYVMNENNACARDSVPVVIHTVKRPNAGLDTSIFLCDIDPVLTVFDLIPGSPDSTGTWKKPNGSPFFGSYNPVVHGSGIYTYTVAGTNPCPDSVSYMMITENTSVNPGADTTISFCSIDNNIELANYISAGADSGGTWKDPSSIITSSSFPTGITQSGAYTYNLTGPPGCPDSSSTIQVDVSTALNPGLNDSVVFCKDFTSHELSSYMVGQDSGGTWTNPFALSHTGTYNSGIDSAGAYTYNINAMGPCPDTSASLYVSLNIPNNPGGDTSLLFCETDSSKILVNLLPSSPTPGGVWKDPFGNTFSGIFTPTVSIPGDLTYNVVGVGVCPDTSSTVTVAIKTSPNPGMSDTIYSCQEDTLYDLFTHLNGNPDTGGIWYNPSNILINNQLNFSTANSGVYTYLLNGLDPCPDTSSFIYLDLETPPNAGVNTFISVCDIDDTLQLFNELNGNADSNGTWKDPLNLTSSGVFVPGISTSGTYIYTVQGQTYCGDQSAELNIFVTNAPNPGISDSVSVCSNDSSFVMKSFLGGTVDSGGVWTTPAGLPAGSNYIPGTMTPGIYTLTVFGQNPCPDSSSYLTVVENDFANPGIPDSMVFCETDSSANLLQFMGGSPDSNGTWFDPNSQIVPSVYLPSTGVTGTFTYYVQGTGACNDSSATLKIDVNRLVNAGIDSAMEYCSNQSPVNLISLLGGNPNTNGVWTGPLGVVANGIFNPAEDSIGLFKYVVQGQSPCPDDSSSVEIAVYRIPNAGLGSDLTLCEDYTPFNFFTHLNGSPDLGGFWTAPNGQHFNGLSGDIEVKNGFYKYTVPGTAPCPDVSSQVQLTIRRLPNAGGSNIVQICSTDEPFKLFHHLTGLPQPNGSWLNPLSQLFGGNFNPRNDSGGVYYYVVPGQHPCRNDTSFIEVVIDKPPNAGNKSDIWICPHAEESNLFEYLTGNPESGGSWKFEDGKEINGQFNPERNVPGIYTYVLDLSIVCPADSADLTVNLYPGFEVFAGEDVDIFYGETKTLSAAAFEAVSYKWTPEIGLDNPNTATPTVTGDYDILYTATGYDVNGCSSSDDVWVNVMANVAVPNSFTPNGDGINDEWEIPGLRFYPNAVVKVYNANGNLLFLSDSNEDYWDGYFNGQKVQNDQYYYVIEFNDNDRLKNLRGFVNVLK